MQQRHRWSDFTTGEKRLIYIAGALVVALIVVVASHGGRSGGTHAAAPAGYRTCWYLDSKDDVDLAQRGWSGHLACPAKLPLAPAITDGGKWWLSLSYRNAPLAGERALCRAGQVTVYGIDGNAFAICHAIGQNPPQPGY